MAVTEATRACGPYSLRLSGRMTGDATRTFRDGRLTALLAPGGRPERATAWQAPDGTLHLAAETHAGLAELHFVLALDDDHSPFLQRFRDDPLLGRATRELRGLRPMRVATVAQALLRALCGQLITSRQARAIERAVIRATMPSHEGLCAPPTAKALGSLSCADLRRLGLHARRGATLVRLCRSLELERLRSSSTSDAANRLERERGLGPWSVGVVCLEGLGRPERGLVGVLGLVKLASALWGRWVEGHETAALLEPYGEWAGLASVYLLAGFRRGLIPLDSPGGRSTANRDPGGGHDRRIAAFRAAERRLALAGRDHRHGPPAGANLRAR